MFLRLEILQLLMTVIIYDRWITLMTALLLENKYLYSIEDILQTKFSARAKLLTGGHGVELEFEFPKKETLFKLKYSEYL